MSDHGQRIDDIMKTSLGLLEANNPFLIVTLPAHLRNSTLRTQLATNRLRHTSNFDLYAAFHEIAHVSRDEAEPRI